MDNETLKAIRERRSCRQYKPQQITPEELRTVLEAGTWAATGKGLQDPWIVAVQDPTEVAKLVTMNSAIMGTSDNPYYGAPTIVLVFASRPEQWKNGMADGSLVLGNMMLAAHSIGLASCWINREREMFDTPEGRELLQHYGLPDNLMGVGALALGYPAVPPRKPKPRKKDYWRVI
jgi:nitroreductase